MTFEIPTANLPKLLSKLTALNNKAVRLGVIPFIVKEGEVTTKNVNGRHISYTIVAVVQEAPVRLDGWEFCGTVEHGTAEDGSFLNVIRAVPGFEFPKAYRDGAPTCDHCKVDRRRRETFVVKDAQGSLRRVGRSCLQDYLGEGMAEATLQSASYIKQVETACEDAMGSYVSPEGWRFDLTEALQRAAQVIRTLGWISRTKAIEQGDTASAETVWDYLTWPYVKHRSDETPPADPTEEDIAAASDTLTWARDIPADVDSDYLYNVRVILSRGTVGLKDVGIATSAVAMFVKKRDAERAAAVYQTKPSSYVGRVGQRFGGKGKDALPVFEATLVKMNSFIGNFGPTTIFTMQDQDGNDFVWFCTGECASVAVGDRVTVQGTIKDHKPNSKTGRKTTYLNRCTLTKV